MERTIQIFKFGLCVGGFFQYDLEKIGQSQGQEVQFVCAEVSVLTLMNANCWHQLDDGEISLMFNHTDGNGKGLTKVKMV